MVPTARGFLPPAVEQDVRLCIRAAQLRSAHLEYPDIALELGLQDPAQAHAMAQTGFAVMPTEDVHEGRRMSNQDLHAAGRVLWEVVENPGPLVSQGKIMMNEENLDVPAVPYPDQMVRVRALEGVVRLEERLARLNGWDAPKKSVIASLPIEEVRAYVERKRAEIARNGGQRVPGELLDG